MNGARTQEILVEVFAATTAPDGDLLGVLCTSSVRDLAVDGAGISLLDEHRVCLPLTATDGRARTLEELQLTLGEVPCIDAFATGRLVTEPDLGQGAHRWPQFGLAAIDAGVGTIFAPPLQLGGIRLGVLDRYCVAPGTLTDAQVVALRARAFADARPIADVAVDIIESRTSFTYAFDGE